MPQIHISVIILTFNEEKNIEACIQSVMGWAKDVYIVDSFSDDRTISMAQKYTSNIYQNGWESFAKQREWAIKNLKLKTEWVLFLDADERMTDELKKEISTLLLHGDIRENGFYIKRRFFFLNRWMKHGGYYPTPEIRMMRYSQVQFIDEDGGARESFLVAGNSGMLKNDMLHIYNKGIVEWVAKHVRLAHLEAADSLARRQATIIPQVEGRIGSVVWLRTSVWNRLPHSTRPILLFFYRYFFRLGFLNGLQGFYYCIMHDLWYPLLVEVFYYEGTLKKNDIRNQ